VAFTQCFRHTLKISDYDPATLDFFLHVISLSNITSISCRKATSRALQATENF
jgi:hypothetical protein